MRKRIDYQYSLHVKLIHFLNSECWSKGFEPAQNGWPAAGELWTATLVEELEKSFQEFAKMSGRLARLAQAKKRCSIPSEGFNYLLAQRMDQLQRALQVYFRRKEELLSHIKATDLRPVGPHRPPSHPLDKAAV